MYAIMNYQWNKIFVEMVRTVPTEHEISSASGGLCLRTPVYFTTSSYPAAQPASIFFTKFTFTAAKNNRSAQRCSLASSHEVHDCKFTVVNLRGCIAYRCHIRSFHINCIFCLLFDSYYCCCFFFSRTANKDFHYDV